MIVDKIYFLPHPKQVMCFHGRAGESESKESLHLLALNKVAKLDFLAHGTSLLVSDLKKIRDNNHETTDTRKSLNLRPDFNLGE